MYRSSQQWCSMEKVVLMNFTKLTGKYLSLFFNKVAETCNFIKKETLTQVFPREFCKISKNTFFYRRPVVVASACTRKKCWKLVPTFFHQFFIFSPNDSPFKNYEKYFLFHLKGSFRSRDIPQFLSTVSRFKRTNGIIYDFIN